MCTSLITANSKKKTGKGYTHKYYSKIVKKYEEFIRPILDKYNDIYTKSKEEKLAFALEKHKHLFLKFIKQAEVPFDNNQAKRDLMMIKVKQKISGCFKSDSNVKYFARIRGYITIYEEKCTPLY